MMETVFNFLIFLLIITTCHGINDEWVAESSPGYFQTYSRLFWFYYCTCPAHVSIENMKQVALNSEGYGKAQFRSDAFGCTCERHFTPKGSGNACIGCDSQYPNRGENRYFFFHSCYCRGACTKGDVKQSLDYMMTVTGNEEETFIHKCGLAPDEDCLCETYSARKGSYQAGCTKDKGWFPCPSTIAEYDEYYNAEIDVYYKGWGLENGDPETSRDIFRRR